MPVPAKRERVSTPNGSDLRQMHIQHNQAVADLAAFALGLSTDNVMSWSSANANSLQALGRGSTDPNIGSGALNFSTAGLVTAKAAVAAGTAIGAQTVPADTW